MTARLTDGEPREGRLLAELLPAGGDAVRVLLQGRHVDVVVRLDQAEHERRSRFGLGAVAHPRLLRRLLEVPRGVLVDDPILRAETHLLPRGVVDVVEHGVACGLSRALAPPLTLEAVVVPAGGRPRLGHVDLASRYATYVRRWVVSRTARVDPAVVTAASVYGVGVVVELPSPAVVVDAGEPVGDGMPEWSWCFAEQAYAAWLVAGCQQRRTVADPHWLVPSR